MLDLSLATLHHLAVFALVALVAAQFLCLRANMDMAAVRRLGVIDAAFGALAGAVVLVGFGRAIWAAKGWEYYAGNTFFWAKVATFVLIGLISIAPTITFIRWRRQGVVPTAEAVARIRRFVGSELLLFVPLLAFAAAMARGFGT